MNTTASKGLKPYFLKVIIVSMSLLYMFGPVHVEVNKLLHAVVHSLEMPDYVLSHQDEKNYIPKVAIHESEEHKKNTEYHDHKVIALLNKILKESDQSSDFSDTYVILSKVYKHIHNNKYDPKNIAVNVVPLGIKHCFLDIEKGLCKGYLWRIRKPPQVYIRIHI